MNNIEEELLQNIKRGENKAIVLLFKSFYSPLCTYATGILKDKETAQEIVQDVFIKIWESGGNLRIETTLKGYLFRSVHNQCLNYIRDNARTKELPFSSYPQSELFYLKIECSPDVIESLFTEDAEKSLAKAMKALPEQCREIFYLCRFEDLSYPEIAVKLNISLSTVKTQMQRAMIKLTEALKDQY